MLSNKRYPIKRQPPRCASQISAQPDGCFQDIQPFRLFGTAPSHCFTDIRHLIVFVDILPVTTANAPTLNSSTACWGLCTRLSPITGSQVSLLIATTARILLVRITGVPACFAALAFYIMDFFPWQAHTAFSLIFTNISHSFSALCEPIIKDIPVDCHCMAVCILTFCDNAMTC